MEKRASVLDRYAGKEFDENAVLIKPGMEYGRELPAKKEKVGIGEKIAYFFARPVLYKMQETQADERINYYELIKEVRGIRNEIFQIQETQNLMREGLSKFIFNQVNQTSQAVKQAKKRK